ncbi:hypothetical protein ACWCV9_35025 [Streptomyces sp. NPDC001606]
MTPKERIMGSSRAKAVTASAAVLLTVLGLANAQAVPSRALQQKVKVYSEPGTYDFTVPAGVTKISVTAVGTGGGGGGGGGAYVAGFAYDGGRGAGGSSGAVVSCDLDVSNART